MVKIGILGITGVLLAVLLKETRPGFSVFISMSVCILIFFYGIGRLEAVADALATLQKAVNLLHHWRGSQLEYKKAGQQHRHGNCIVAEKDITLFSLVSPLFRGCFFGF